MHRFGEQIDVHLAQMQQDGKIDYDITGGSWYIVLKSDDEATQPATEPAVAANTAWHQLRDTAISHPLLGRRFRSARAPVVGTTIRVAESQEEGEETEEEEADGDAGVLGPPASEGDYDAESWRQIETEGLIDSESGSESGSD
eukprot:COSAG01_NODE_1576_length_9855_cov_32.477962_15_plen_143_part_00